MPSFVTINNDAISGLDKSGLSAVKVNRYPIKDNLKDGYEFKPTTLKAVDQTPLPGTLVAPGTKVVVFFEDTDGLTIDIFEGVHAGYSGMKATDAVSKANDNDAVKIILESGKESKDLTVAEQEVMTTFFVETIGLEIDESDLTKNTQSAYDGMVVSYGLIKG